MVGSSHSFFNDFSDVVLPLICCVLTDFVWSNDCQLAFQNAKALFCSVPMLAAPAFNLPFKLEVDASGTGGGAVLCVSPMLGCLMI